MAEMKSKPVSPAKEPTPPETEEWIYTIKSKSGEVVKIERVDPQTGERKEVPMESLYPAAAYGDYGYSPYGAYQYDPYAYDPYGGWGYGY